MANCIRNPFAPGSSICFANHFTDSFLMTWMVAASDLSRTDWEFLFVAWLGERTQLAAPPGMAGFDLLDLPWSASNLHSERQFFVRSCIAMQTLLEEHVGGVLASGFADDGNRSREGQPRRWPLSEDAHPTEGLGRGARVLEGWFRRLSLDDLRARVDPEASPQYHTPWRDDPFPTSVAGLRQCVAHNVMYAPGTGAGCCLCQDAAEYARRSRRLG